MAKCTLMKKGLKLSALFSTNLYKKKGTYTIAHELQEAGIKPMYGKEWRNTLYSIEQPEPSPLLMQNIKNVINGLLYGVLYEDEFYAQFLHKIILHNKSHIDIYFNALPFKWSYNKFEN